MATNCVLKGDLMREAHKHSIRPRATKIYQDHNWWPSIRRKVAHFVSAQKAKKYWALVQPVLKNNKIIIIIIKKNFISTFILKMVNRNDHFIIKFPFIPQILKDQTFQDLEIFLGYGECF